MGMLYHNVDMEEQDVVGELTALYTSVREKDYPMASRIHLDHLRAGRESTLLALAKMAEG